MHNLVFTEVSIVTV